MDTKSEDTMIRQIEKNLSNNVNDDLFHTGRIVESNKPIVKSRNSLIKLEDINRKTEKAEDTEEGAPNKLELPLVSNENLNYAPRISRAEYIRQAREACLRQLSSVQLYSKPYEVNYMDSEPEEPEQTKNKKAKLTKLFGNEAEEENSATEENTPQELAAYRSLIIRSVCAIAIFLCVFIIDKFKLSIGNISYSMIEEYVTGKDTLQVLEDILVTWLK